MPNYRNWLTIINNGPYPQDDTTDALIQDAWASIFINERSEWNVGCITDERL